MRHGLELLASCYRIAGHMTLKDAIALTSVGEDSFLQDPPNAVLTMMDGEQPIVM